MDASKLETMSVSAVNPHPIKWPGCRYICWRWNGNDADFFDQRGGLVGEGGFTRKNIRLVAQRVDAYWRDQFIAGHGHGSKNVEAQLIINTLAVLYPKLITTYKAVAVFHFADGWWVVLVTQKPETVQPILVGVGAANTSVWLNTPLLGTRATPLSEELF